jgi:hypothetical protein
MRCRISGRVTDSEIPLLVMLFYLFHYVESTVLCAVVLVLSVIFSVIYVEDNVSWGVWLGRHIC